MEEKQNVTIKKFSILEEYLDLTQDCVNILSKICCFATAVCDMSHVIAIKGSKEIENSQNLNISFELKNFLNNWKNTTENPHLRFLSENENLYTYAQRAIIVNKKICGCVTFLTRHKDKKCHIEDTMAIKTAALFLGAMIERELAK